ncbi:hypothetical protein E2C01_080935 [Portunus trituberculatus]|uniref:Uncharacterized protein n=1 Tax=Portunus trituberculatus TaxID=210409 RepID=A0A5B7IVA9_PORTR|nr:hypothetical protein [Portunus trituberculatus]
MTPHSEFTPRSTAAPRGVIPSHAAPLHACYYTLPHFSYNTTSLTTHCHAHSPTTLLCPTSTSHTSHTLPLHLSTRLTTNTSCLHRWTTPHRYGPQPHSPQQSNTTVYFITTTSCHTLHHHRATLIEVVDV